MPSASESSCGSGSASDEVPTIPLYLSTVNSTGANNKGNSVPRHYSGYPLSVRRSQDSLASVIAVKPPPPPLPPKPSRFQQIRDRTLRRNSYIAPNHNNAEAPTSISLSASSSTLDLLASNATPKGKSRQAGPPPPLPPRTAASDSAPNAVATTHPFSPSASTSSPSTSLAASLYDSSSAAKLTIPPTRNVMHQVSTGPTHTSAPSSSSLGSSGRLANATNLGLGIKDRLVAGAGIGMEWGKKGKHILSDKLQERRMVGKANATTELNGRASMENLGSRDTTGHSTVGTAGGLGVGTNGKASLPRGHQHSRSTSSVPGSSDNPLKLPAMILGVRVPRKSGVAFGVALNQAVEVTRVPLRIGKVNEDEVVGDKARQWLPAVALRSLEYLEEWGRKEEGIYRVPGSSHQIAQLRALFDAGMDIDLREIHPGDLDPHAVASLFKLWLRELPNSLLSDNLVAAVDVLVKQGTGYSASATPFLNQAVAQTSPSSTLLPTTTTQTPRELCDQLATLFSTAMPAEEFYLLRAIAYHLAHLAAHSATNKMTLANLRLVLTPTLRLSPKMLQILVEERGLSLLAGMTVRLHLSLV